MNLAEAVGPTSDSVVATLTPADQGQDWRRRWQDIERENAEFRRPRTGPLSGETIQAAHRELQAFYTLAYHLKDLLILQSGIAKQIIENAITTTPALAVLADLANTDKHGQLVSPPRSGTAPSVVSRSGTTREGGWQLNLVIQHGPDTLDGLDVAHKAVDAWQQLLRGWALI